ncbi:uncharacterized protein LOC129820675 isoform X2 [Salvelinus fontinalis]|uniref:uncharacterized protein LOC129820675 isoform X2 n=1 Tax=Salvelinus fontinalis TaxID=8038 RepID=UPI002486A6DC|nr:uncharacterized protein LOC129820675 isoform X2 [Salvelinus fontinalis]
MRRRCRLNWRGDETTVTKTCQTLSIENPLESISGLLTAAESHRQSAAQTEDDHQSPLDISSLHLSQERLNTSSTVGMEEVKERGAEGGEEQPTSLITEEEENEGMGEAFSPQTPARMKAVSSTPTFSLNSHSGSPSHLDGSTVKSPAFLFSMSSAPTDFSGFHCGFDLGGSGQEEEPPFPFSSSYFSTEKKPSGSKSPSGFLFARPESEKSEDGFEFPFSSKSPGQPSTSRDKGSGAGDSFPFSFNF